MRYLLTACLLVSGCSHPVDPPLYMDSGYTCDASPGSYPVALGISDGTVSCLVMYEVATNQCMLVRGSPGAWVSLGERPCQHAVLR